MSDHSTNGSGPRPATTRRCFVISAIGGDTTERLSRQQVLRHLVRKVLEPRGYEVKRADEIDDPGQITHQIIEHLLDDELVVADLTGRNPNVFYELAVRHAARKPVITLMSDGEDLPFDLKDVRTVFYDLHDPDKLEAAQRELEDKVTAIEENPDEVRNPITVARDVSLLRASENPDFQAAGAVLSAVNDLRDEMRMLTQRQAENRRPLPLALIEQRVRAMCDGNELVTPVATEVLASRLGEDPTRVGRVLERLAAAGAIHKLDEGWSIIPF
jgi:DNA-binding transcriptional ArsR family regulator